MEKFDWKLTISLNILKLKVVGLWPAGDETYRPNLYTLWAIFCITLFTFGHNFFQAINIIFIFSDLEAVVASTFVTLPELLTLLKVYGVIRNMKLVKQLMVVLNSDIFQPKNARQINLIGPSLKFWKIIYVLYWSASLGAIFFWSTYPLMDKSFKDYRLPFLAWYPYNNKISPFYEITYIYQILGVCFIATTALSIDTLIAALNVYTGAQFDILADNIKHLYDDTSTDFNEKLINSVRHHREILKFAENTGKFSNWIVMGQFFISAISIGITMFQLTSVKSTVEIFMFCWFGNEVEVKVYNNFPLVLTTHITLFFFKSNQLPYAAYESNWINAPTDVKTKMILFIMRCQKPCKMSALNLFYLSLNTFMSILRASWSYFALLHQVSSRG
ncbi:7tm 6 domain containing protein, partial [Asbolus verrucosus]